MPFDVRVKAVLMEENEHTTIVHGRSAQLSEGGIGVTMTREMPKGTVATLIFKLPGDEDERTLLRLRIPRDFPADAEGIAPILYAGGTIRAGGPTRNRRKERKKISPPLWRGGRGIKRC